MDKKVFLFAFLILSLTVPQAYGLGYIVDRFDFELSPGSAETKNLTVILDKPGNLIVSVSGDGSEFITIQEKISVDKGSEKSVIPIIVIIPHDAKEGKFDPFITVLQENKGEGSVVINEEILVKLHIKVLDMKMIEDKEIIINEIKPIVEPTPELIAEPIRSEQECGDGTMMVDGFCKIIKEELSFFDKIINLIKQLFGF